MTIEIRDAKPSDVLALCALRAPRVAHERKLELAESGIVRFLLAQENDLLVGFALVFLSNPAAGPQKSHIPKLSDLHVRPSHRRRGIGRRLVEAREGIAREAGHCALFVSVDPKQNAPWLEFFLRRGYHLLQEAPYRKTEQWIREDGESVPVEAWRHDLALQLQRGSSHLSVRPTSPCT